MKKIRGRMKFRAMALASVSVFTLSFCGTALANPSIVVDVRTLKVVEHSDAFRRWYPASLTKLMTAYTVFRAIKAGEVTLDSPVTMSKHAAAQPPSKMFYKPGQSMTLDSALKIILVKSANDVSVAIAESVGGSEPAFVSRMNAEARRIGMISSNFINPNGLPGKGQYTTACDLAVLAVTLKREFPEYASYFALEGFTTGKKDYPNYNMLIGRFDGADGMKTGFICASGFNQVSSATRNGRSVVSVVLGTDSLAARAEESARLMEKALTENAGAAPALGNLVPYGNDRDQVADISKQICSKEAAKVRSEGRDEAGRMKIQSPYIRELTRPLKLVFAGLSPSATGKADAAADMAGEEIANVPIPIPRPTTF